MRAGASRRRSSGLCLGTPATARIQATLWVVDDVQETVTTITPSGQFLAAFPTVAGAKSCIALDPSDDTLWGTSEGHDRVVHYDKNGQLIAYFPTSVFDPNADQPEGIDVNPSDDTLWVVDDSSLLVYNLMKDGTMIRSFPTSDYDPFAVSPQGLAYDVVTDTLWLTDNSSDAIYNVSTSGQLISFFPVETFDPNATNLQDICVPRGSTGTLWVTARNTATIYEITTTGALLASTSTLPFGIADPTGILFEDVPSEPATFCTAKTALFCGPASISALGVPSATSNEGFVVSAGPTRRCRWGMLLYNDQPVQPGIPFGGPGDGLLCLSGSFHVAGMIDSGSTSPIACGGELSIDMNAFARSLYTPGGCHPPLHVTPPAGFLSTPGTTVNAQMFGRDSIATGQVLSDGISFVILP